MALIEQNAKLTMQLEQMEQKYDQIRQVYSNHRICTRTVLLFSRRISKAESKARRSQIMAAVESGTLRGELQRINEQMGLFSSQMTRRMADMIAEVISLPQFLIY